MRRLTLTKKLLRDLRDAKGQVLAVAAVIAAGIIAYTALNSAFRDLLLTRDAYVQSYRLAHLFFHVERAPASVVRRIAAVPGVIQAEGRLVFDVTLDLPGRTDPAIGRFVSIPDRPGKHVNDIHVASGRRPSPPGSSGVLLSAEFAEVNGFSIGSSFDALISDKKHSLQVVGTGLSPEYVYMIRSIQDFVPDPKSFGVLWGGMKFAEQAFGYENAVNDVVVRIENGADGEALLERIGDILEPFGLLYKHERKDQISYRVLDDKLKGIQGAARSVPTVFVLVASVVLFLLVGRMVKRQRQQIGVLKAFGYGDVRILTHFAAFSLAIGILGTAAGLAAGDWLARVMVEMMADFFRFPILRHRIHPDIFFGGLAFGLLGPFIAGVLAARRAARLAPAVALRPPTPAPFKAVALLEGLPFLWRRLPFTWKMVFRNLGRQRGRSVFVVLAVALSAAIMIMVLSMRDGMNHLLDFQYELVNRQDAKVLLSRERGMEALYDARDLPGVEHAEAILELPFEVGRTGFEKNIMVVGVAPDSRLLHLLDKAGRRIHLPASGVVLPDLTAASLKVRAGDTLTMKPLQPGFDEREVRVSRVVPQYLGQVAYMDIRFASRLVDEPFAMNGVLLEVRRGSEAELVSSVKEVPAVATVEMKSWARRNFKEGILDLMQAAMFVYVLFAGVISFAVIYTGATLAIGERARELASLRILGATHSEVARTVFGEYFILSGLGVLAGFPLGLLFARGLSLAYKSELYSFPFIVQPATYIQVAAAIAVFLLLARLACERPLRKLDMTATLKRSD